MTARISLAVARMHGVLVARPSSPVFHVYAGPLTQSGRFVPRASRPVCGARTRRLVVVERAGACLDTGGRRVCERCSVRLSAIARRAEQPPLNHDQAVVFWKAAKVTLGDLAVAITLAGSVAETHSIGLALGQVFPPPPARRPATGFGVALFDIHGALLTRRDDLRAAERTPDEIHAARTRREMQADEAERQRVAQTRAYQHARHEDRLNAGQYTTAWERTRAAQHA